MPEGGSDSRRHVVAAGESIPTIAEGSGHFWETIWNAPENAELAKLRGDASILCPGDDVFVEAIRVKSVPAATGAKHVFRRRGVPSLLRLRLLDGGAPRAGEPYLLELDDGRVLEGILDDSGHLQCFVSAAVRQAVLTLGDDEPVLVEIGHLLPIATDAGVQQRLRSLGYLGADATPAGVEAALREFQRKASLPVTGQLDDATSSALAAAHDQRETS